MKLWNYESEKYILGSMICDNKLIRKIQEALKVEYFYNPEHLHLYESILKIYEKNKAVDIAMLNEFDFAFIAEIAETIITTSNIRQHIKIVRELAIRRDIIKSTEKIRNIAITEDMEIETVKSESLSILNGISIPEKKRSQTKMLDIATSFLNNLENRYKQGVNPNKSWGLQWLDDKTGGIKPEFTILAARPSVGKTALALQLGKCVAEQGAKVAIFSLEMSRDMLTGRMIANHGRIDKTLFDKTHLLKDEHWQAIGRVSSQIAMLPITMFDDVMYIEEIVLKCEEMKADEGLDLVIIDYIQLVETHKKTTNANERVSHISRALKKLQQSNNIHLLALSQFNRETEKQTLPTLSNLRDSGSLEQDANNVWFLHVDSKDSENAQKVEYIETQLIIAKQREGERNIKKKLKFYGKTQRFYEN